MSACVCTCVYVCMLAYMRVYVCVHVYMRVYTCVHMCEFVCIATILDNELYYIQCL